MPDQYTLYEADATEREVEFIAAIREHGSERRANIALGLANDVVSSAMRRMRARASRLGRAPGHFDNGTAPGYLMGKVTIQRGASGDVERVWERQHPEVGGSFAAREEALERRIERITPLPEVRIPGTFGPKNTFNQISIFDGHVGAHAWNRETGSGNWDLRIARLHLTVAACWLLDNLPVAQDVLILIGGDFTEIDGYKPLTPESGHLLDADGRYPYVFEVAEEIIEATVCHALQRYRKVILCIRPGNHDKSTAMTLRRVFMRAFRDNPRVEVDQSIRDYWAMLFGKTMIACHHGDKAKLEQLPMIFASDFAAMWGQATFRVCHSGHWHHEKLIQSRGIEQPGMMMIQHPTMERRNAWAAGKGLIAARQLVGHSYHSGGGLLTSLYFNPALHGLDEAA